MEMVKNIFIEEKLIEHIKEYDVVLIGTGIKNSMYNGFQKEIAVNFPEVEKINKETKYDDIKKLGTCQVITKYHKDGFPIFVLCYITKGRYRPDIKPDTLEYASLRTCFEIVNEHFKGKKVATTLMGSSKFEGGGDSKRIYQIIMDTCNDIDLDIYDYEQDDVIARNKDTYYHIVKDYKDGVITKDEYEDRMKKYLWESEIGIYNGPVPEGNLWTVRKKIKEIKFKRKNKRWNM